MKYATYLTFFSINSIIFSKERVRNMKKKIYYLIPIILIIFVYVLISKATAPHYVDNIEPISEIQIPILMYHHFTNNIEECTDNIILVDKFKDDMQVLKDNGYTAISFDELYNFVANNGNIPQKPIIVTIDDGYYSNYEYGYDILQNLDMKATIFVIGNSVGNFDLSLPHFSYEQAKQMYDSGIIDIQSHTYNLHDISIRKGLLKLESESESEYISMLNNDLTLSKNDIETNVGNSVFVLSYPYGLYDNLALETIKELGFKITVVTDEGISTVTRNNLETLYNLKRINIDNSIAGNELIEKIEQYLYKEDSPL